MLRFAALSFSEATDNEAKLSDFDRSANRAVPLSNVSQWSLPGHQTPFFERHEGGVAPAVIEGPGVFYMGTFATVSVICADANIQWAPMQVLSTYCSTGDLQSGWSWRTSVFSGARTGEVRVCQPQPAAMLASHVCAMRPHQDYHASPHPSITAGLKNA